jgi:hypothetical protein
VGQEKLQSYYKTNFALMQHHKYTLEDIENMIPFEREVYVMLLSQYVNEENTKIQERQAQMKANANKRRKV